MEESLKKMFNWPIKMIYISIRTFTFFHPLFNGEAPLFIARPLKLLTLRSPIFLWGHPISFIGNSHHSHPKRKPFFKT